MASLLKVLHNEMNFLHQSSMLVINGFMNQLPVVISLGRLVCDQCDPFIMQMSKLAFICHKGDVKVCCKIALSELKHPVVQKSDIALVKYEVR